MIQPHCHLSICCSKRRQLATLPPPALLLSLLALLRAPLTCALKHPSAWPIVTHHEAASNFTFSTSLPDAKCHPSPLPWALLPAGPSLWDSLFAPTLGQTPTSSILSDTAHAHTHTHTHTQIKIHMCSLQAFSKTHYGVVGHLGPLVPLERLMLKVKLQYFGHLMPRADSLEKTLMLGKIEGRRRRGQQRMR